MLTGAAPNAKYMYAYDVTLSWAYSAYNIAQCTGIWLSQTLPKLRLNPVKALAMCFLFHDSMTYTSASLLSQSCPVNTPPLFYDRYSQCPAYPPTQNFISEKLAKSISSSFLISSNYPLTHVQIFIFGATHSSPDKGGQPNALSLLISKTISDISKNGDTMLLEGLLTEQKDLCSVFREKYTNNFFPIKPTLVCQGWEVEAEQKAVKKRYIQLMHYLNTNEEFDYEKKKISLSVRIQFLTAQVKALRETENLFNPLNFLYFFLKKLLRDAYLGKRDLSEDIKKLDKEIQHVTKKYNNVEKSAKKYSAKRNKIISGVSTFWEDNIEPRNKGILAATENILQSEPDKRIFISGGALHFFTKESMIRYDAHKGIASLRKYLEQKESAGHPVAYFYPRSDIYADAYLKGYK